MLPGLRFLFAAILLSTSILVFGLGAAALLRATHEEFVSNPSWRTGLQEQVFAQQTEPREAVLAALRVEPPAELTSPEPALPAPAPEAVTPAAKEPEQVAVVAPEAAAPPESPKLELAPVSHPTIGLPQQPYVAAPATDSAAPASVPGRTETPADDAKLAAIQEALAAVEVAPPGTAKPASVDNEQIAGGAAPGNSDGAATRTAALPDPAVATERESGAKENNVTEQRVQRARKRQRTARRSPPPPQPPVAPIFDPFAPLVQPVVKQTRQTR